MVAGFLLDAGLDLRDEFEHISSSCAAYIDDEIGVPVRHFGAADRKAL